MVKSRWQEVLAMLIKRPGLSVTEYAKEMGNKSVATASEQLKLLEEKKHCRVEFVQEGRGIEKHYFPSFEGHLVDIANARGKKQPLSKDDIKAIDDFLFHPKFKELIFKKSAEAKALKDSVPLPAMATIMLLTTMSDLKEKAGDIENDPELHSIFNKFNEAWKKFSKVFS